MNNFKSCSDYSYEWQLTEEKDGEQQEINMKRTRTKKRKRRNTSPVPLRKRIPRKKRASGTVGERQQSAATVPAERRRIRQIRGWINSFRSCVARLAHHLIIDNDGEWIPLDELKETGYTNQNINDACSTNKKNYLSGMPMAEKKKQNGVWYIRILQWVSDVYKG